MSKPLDLSVPQSVFKADGRTPQTPQRAAAGFLEHAKEAYDRLQRGALTPGGFHLAVTTDLQNLAVGLELSKSL